MGKGSYWKGKSSIRRGDNIFSFGKTHRTTIYQHGHRWSGSGITPEKSQRAASDKYHSGSKGSKGGCFITSACVEARGLPDSCLELTTLRTFRDSYLVRQENGKDMIKEYYAKAPDIVEAINQQKNAEAIYAGLYKNLVQRSVDLISKGKSSEAADNYSNVFQELQRKYL